MPDKITPRLQGLNSFQRNVYSQCGEDGIVEEVLTRIGKSSQLDGWCVEFGALDGIHLSNTYNLIRHKNYKAVLIEGDKRQYGKLCRNIPQSEAIKILQFVTFEGQSTLDRILQTTSIPDDFDFLSIDIDGCDYHVFESLGIYRPKIVCIEYNLTIPNEVAFIQAKDFSVKQGSSAKSIVELAARKGYCLAAVTHCNLILIRSDFNEAVLGRDGLSLEDLRDDHAFRTFIFFGYDGTVLTNKDSVSIPWHRIRLGHEHLQQLPGYLRKFGGDYNFLQKLAFGMFLLLRFPGSLPAIFQDKFVKKYLKRR